MQFKAWRFVKEVPSAQGTQYQLWARMPVQQPMGPAFNTQEELAAWCETNATVFASIKADKETWLRFIRGEEYLTLQLTPRN